MRTRLLAARRKQAGFSLIELLMALAMLTVGMAGIAIMVVSAISTDYRNKNDTTSTALAQLVLSQIASYSAGSGTNPTVTDCAPQTWTINTATGGSDLYTSNSLPSLIGDVNWTSTSTTYTSLLANNYAMRYQTCSGSTYEVRWNITAVDAYSNQVSVSARAVQAGSANATLAQLQYGTPVTLRSIVGR